MTQTNETNSRIARLEALMLEIAASNLRHDRTNERQDDALNRVNQTLDRIAARQDQHDQALTRIEAQQELNQQAIAQLTAQQNYNGEQLTQLTANMLDLRTLVAEYIQARSHPNP